MTLTPAYETAQQLLEQLQAEILQHFYHARELPIFPNVSSSEVRTHLAAFDFSEPLPLMQVLGESVAALRKYTVHITHPGYMGLFNPAVSFSSVLADALISLYNPQLAAWSHSPWANEMEQHTLRYIGGKLGMAVDENFSASYTAGGSEANHSALLAALAHAYPEYVTEGLAAIGVRPVVYVSEQAHNSFDKVCKHTGLGTRALRTVPTTPDLKLDVDALRQMMQADRAAGYTPLMVVGTAGTTAAGIIDPLPELALLCNSENLWLHVDAAWAGVVAFHDEYRTLLQGIADADSITVDAHKWLSVPYGAGMFFTRHRSAVDVAFGVTASYMPPSPADIVNPFQTTLHWSRRCIGLKVFFTLCEWGEAGLAELVARKMQLGERLRAQLTESGWQFLNRTALPVVCFTHPKLEDGATTRQQVLQDLYALGDVWISEAALDPKGNTRCLRACITNYKTTEAEVDTLVRQLNGLIEKM